MYGNENILLCLRIINITESCKTDRGFQNCGGDEHVIITEKKSGKDMDRHECPTMK